MNRTKPEYRIIFAVILLCGTLVLSGNSTIESRLSNTAQLDDHQSQAVIKEFETEFDSWAQMERDSFSRYVSGMPDSQLLRVAGMMSTLIEYEGSMWPFFGQKVAVYEKKKIPAGFAAPGYYYDVLRAAITKRISRAALAITVSYIIAEVEVVNVSDSLVVTLPWGDPVGMRLFRSRVSDVIKGRIVHPGDHIVFGYAPMWKTEAGEGFPPDINPGGKYIVLLEARNYRSFSEAENRDTKPVELYALVPYIDMNCGSYPIQHNRIIDIERTFSGEKQISVTDFKNKMRTILHSFRNALVGKE